MKVGILPLHKYNNKSERRFCNMNTKKNVTKLSLFALMFFLASGLSNQVRAEVYCETPLTKPGIDTSINSTPDDKTDDYVIWVKCSWWTAARPMMFHPDLGEGAYATALTAISLDRTVNVTMESGDWYSLITKLEVN